MAMINQDRWRRRRCYHNDNHEKITIDSKPWNLMDEKKKTGTETSLFGVDWSIDRPTDRGANHDIMVLVQVVLGGFGFFLRHKAPNIAIKRKVATNQLLQWQKNNNNNNINNNRTIDNEYNVQRRRRRQ